MPELITLRKEKTNSSYGKPPEARAIEELLQKGIVNVDKPAGPTSYQVTDFVKNILNAKKAGHAGTLDPHVSGLLVIGINDGTKILKAQLEAPKEYVCLMYLHREADTQRIKGGLKEFTGPLFQRPPIKAAVSRILRIREVYEAEMVEQSGKNVLFRVSCESGTYIRRLCHDMGLAIGTGAHMQQLRRTKSGAFGESSLTTLHDLSDAYALWKEEVNEKPLRKIIYPMERGLDHLKKVIISDYAVNPLAHGAQLAIPGVLQLSKGIELGELVAVFTQKDEGVMLAKALMGTDEISETEKGVAFKTERILIEPNIYPRAKK